MRLQLNIENIATLAGINGYRTVSSLARHIGRHRFSVYRALRNPNRHRPTFEALSSALPVRTLPK